MIDVQNEKDKISEKHKCSKLENKFPPKNPFEVHFKENHQNLYFKTGIL
jgi:hypothetical protein